MCELNTKHMPKYIKDVMAMYEAELSSRTIRCLARTLYSTPISLAREHRLFDAFH